MLEGSVEFVLILGIKLIIMVTHDELFVSTPPESRRGCWVEADRRARTRYLFSFIIMGNRSGAVRQESSAVESVSTLNS